MRATPTMLLTLASLVLAGCSTQPESPVAEPVATEPPALKADAPTQPFFAELPRWRPIYQGIEFAELANDKPRPLVVSALRIDTAAEGLELFTTPGNGEARLETNGQTTRAFLEEHDLDVAINTHFFSPCCNIIPGEPKDLTGLAIAQGEHVSPASIKSQRDIFIFEAGVHERGSLDAVMLTSGQMDQLEGFTPTHAIAGRTILYHGRVVEGGDKFSTTLHPRTLVGLSEDYNTLYLVTIDGRQLGYSTGASLAEAAAIMFHLGAAMALNVDGGGSTTMIIRDADGASQVANSPSSGFERVVGSNLGLRALPLQPTGDAMP